MIFALFIILLFAGMVAFVQFGMPEGTAQPRARLYAENMSIWHQAAILQAQDDMAGSTPFTPPCAATPCNAVNLTGRLWNSATGQITNKLLEFWPEYLPMVPIVSNFSGWDSYLIRRINTADGTADGPEDTETYVLTYFRGFSYATGGGAAPPEVVGSEKGSTDESNFIRSLADSVTERAGMGTLVCDGVAPPPAGECRFFRVAAQTVPDGAPTAESDISARIPLIVFPVLQRPLFNGRPAMLTRINTNS